MSDSKTVNIQSDYDPSTTLTITRQHDGDIVVGIKGDGEFRIAMNGSLLQGQQKTKVLKAFGDIIEIINSKSK